MLITVKGDLVLSGQDSGWVWTPERVEQASSALESLDWIIEVASQIGAEHMDGAMRRWARELGMEEELAHAMRDSSRNLSLNFTARVDFPVPDLHRFSAEERDEMLTETAEAFDRVFRPRVERTAPPFPGVRTWLAYSTSFAQNSVGESTSTAAKSSS